MRWRHTSNGGRIVVVRSSSVSSFAVFRFFAFSALKISPAFRLTAAFASISWVFASNGWTLAETIWRMLSLDSARDSLARLFSQ
jgi:hypothetical protein